MLKMCQKCGEMNPSATGAPGDACPACGTAYEAPQPVEQVPEPAAQPLRTKRPDEKFCIECGSLINIKAEICPKCGVRQMAPPPISPLGPTTANGRNKTVAGLLALFLGGLGAHKFYLGKGLLGALYLVFCWTFIPSILGLLEGLNFFLMSQETFTRRYGEN